MLRLTTQSVFTYWFVCFNSSVLISIFAKKMCFLAPESHEHFWLGLGKVIGATWVIYYDCIWYQMAS